MMSDQSNYGDMVSGFVALEDETVIDYFNRMAEKSLDKNTQMLVAYQLAASIGQSIDLK